VIPFAFYKYGKQIRRRSKFAPTEETEGQKPDDEEQQRRNVIADSNAELPTRPGALRVHDRDRDVSVVSSSSEESAVVVGAGRAGRGGREGGSGSEGERKMQEKRREEEEETQRRRDDDLQNALGEPRDENRNFGNEG